VGDYLAGGEGKRLPGLFNVQARYGVDYSNNNIAPSPARRSMLRHTIDRAEMLIHLNGFLTLVSINISNTSMINSTIVH